MEREGDRYVKFSLTDDSIVMDTSTNMAEGLAVSFFGYLKNAVKTHEKTLKDFEAMHGLRQENNIILRSLFILFPFTEENRCIIRTLRKMEKNDEEDFIVGINLKTDYVSQGK